MPLQTAFTRMLSITYPIVLAPMGVPSGGVLAAAVSNAGGLGLVGGGAGKDRERLEREVGLVIEQATQPWGIGFISWAVSADLVAWAVRHQPAAVMLSFGDPHPFAGTVRDAGVILIVQVTTLNEVRQALDAGADVIVAQGGEAGGHCGTRSTMAFVPAVVDLAGPVPVLAAGGIADGRGLAASLALGAAGALIGTRFVATPESITIAAAKNAIIRGHGDDTESGRVHDIAAGVPWPEQFRGRSIRNAFSDRWRGREAELAADTEALSAYRQAVAAEDLDVFPVWAGEDIDLIHALQPAATLVQAIAADAVRALNRARNGEASAGLDMTRGHVPGCRSHSSAAA
jgi:nitronate monooxygenase